MKIFEYLRLAIFTILMALFQVAGGSSFLHSAGIANAQCGSEAPSIDHQTALLYDFILTSSIGAGSKEFFPSEKTSQNYSKLKSLSLKRSSQPEGSLKTYLPSSKYILPGLRPVDISFPFQDFV